MNIHDSLNMMIAVVFSGSDLAGTLSLQGSFDGISYVSMGVNQTVSSAGIYIWDVGPTSVRQIRFTWTYSSGTGTMTANGAIKQQAVSLVGSI